MFDLIRIDEIRLNNFLSHSSSNVKFKGSINVILGPNGAGKSSIIDGILFSLYRESTRGKQEELIKRGKRSASLELVIEAKNNKIRIKRNIPISQDDVIFVNEAISSRGATNVTKRVQELLGLNKDLALSTIFVEQGKIEDVFKDLEDVFKALLKIDKIEKLVETNGPIKHYIDTLKIRLEDLEKVELKSQEIRKELEELKENLSKLEEELKGKRSKIQLIESQLQSLKDKLTALDDKRKKYLELTSQRSSILGQLEDLNTEITNLEKETKDIEEWRRKVDELRIYRDLLPQYIVYLNKKESLDKLNKNIETLLKKREEVYNNLIKKKQLEPIYNEYVELQRLLNEINEKYTRYVALESSIEELKGKLEEKRRELEGLKEPDLESIIKQLEDKKAQRDRLNETLGGIRANEQRLIDSINGLNKAAGRGVCPVCGRELSEHTRQQLIDEYNKQLLDLRSKKDKISEQLRQLSGELDRLEKQRDQAQKVLSQIQSLREDIKKLEKEIDEKKKELNSLKTYYDRYIDARKKQEEMESKAKEYLKYSSYKDEDLKELDNQLGELKKEKKDIEDSLKELEQSLGNYKSLTLNYINAKVKELEESEKILKDKNEKAVRLNSLKEQVERFKEQLNDVESKIAQLGYNEEEYDKVKQEIDKLTQQYNSLNAEIGNIEGQLSSKKDMIAQLEKELQEYESELAQRNKIEQAINKLTNLRTALGDKYLQRYLIYTAKGIVEDYLNDTLSKFDLSFSRVELDFSEKGGLVIYLPSGQKIGVNSLSGGERIALALALRLSLARMMISDIGFIILDEPTIFLDKQRRSDLLEIIRSAVDVVPQIIVVTHDEELLNVADYVIEVSKENDTSIVKVEGEGDDKKGL